MTQPAYVREAEEALNQARQTLGEVTGDLHSSGIHHEEATATLKSAIGAYLIDRKDPKILARLKEAEEAETKARRALDYAKLTFEAAKDNVTAAEAHLRAMVHREGSDIIMEAGRALVTLSEDIDRDTAALAAKIKEAAALAERMELAADSKMDNHQSSPEAWRRDVVESIAQTLKRVGTPSEREVIPVATATAKHRYNWLRSHPYYTPSVPDPDLEPSAKEAA